ncbi:MAG: peptidoglycan DD-metalloendopeptidase family protein [Acidimicrobiia bacterium]
MISQSSPHPSTITVERHAYGVRLLVAAVLAVLAVLVPLLPAEASSSDDLAAAQAKADSLARQLIELETTLVGLEERIDELETEATATETQIDEMSEAVRVVMVERYINGTNKPSVVSSDPLETARLDTLMGAAQDKSNQLIAEFQALHERLDDTRQNLETEQRDHQATQAELQESIAELDEELERLGELVRLDEAKAAREAAEAAAAKATSTSNNQGSSAAPKQPTTPTPTVSDANNQAPAATVPPTTAPAPTTTTTVPATTTTTAPKPPASGGGWVCPVRPSSFVPESWAAPRSGGRSHKGIDLHAAAGTPTVAPVSGRVEHRSNSLGGLAWHLYGDDGNYYYGAHLSAYGASGQVSAGEVIGYVGATGNANGINHLHFEYHLGGYGNAVNPYSLLRAACG